MTSVPFRPEVCRRDEDAAALEQLGVDEERRDKGVLRVRGHEGAVIDEEGRVLAEVLGSLVVVYERDYMRVSDNRSKRQ